ncbi:uncharacterized protein LOC142223255 [Haematobia irritans]|uniref:uncharacterized protein LOC142223255 n=1 Tax=Haematobia irritans TaxID=7368 RepID=UPI003F509E54
MADEKQKTQSPANILDDEDFSDITKKEILYWSRKLAITPKQLFTMPKDELDKNLRWLQTQTKLDEEGRKRYYERWNRMIKLKSDLNEKLPHTDRLKGGAGRTIWDILADAADQIEEVYGDQSYYNASVEDTFGYDDTINSTAAYTTYDSTRSCPFPTDMTYTLTDDEPSLESTFEDSFQIDPNLASTPQVPYGPRRLPANDTYSVPMTVARGISGKAKQCPIDMTYDIRDNQTAANATYNILQCPRNETYDISADNSPAWSPQAMAYVDNSESEYLQWNPTQGAYLDEMSPPQGSGPNETTHLPTPSFRNFTDYSLKYSPGRTEETANSISVESYDETSGIIKASSRSYSLPATADLANMTFDIPNISPQHSPRSANRCPTKVPCSKCPNRGYNSQISSAQKTSPYNRTYDVIDTPPSRNITKSPNRCAAPQPKAKIESREKPLDNCMKLNSRSPTRSQFTEATTDDIPIGQTPVRTPVSSRRNYRTRQISDHFDE